MENWTILFSGLFKATQSLAETRVYLCQRVSSFNREVSNAGDILTLEKPQGGLLNISMENRLSKVLLLLLFEQNHLCFGNQRRGCF